MTVRLVAQCLNQLRYRVPPYDNVQVSFNVHGSVHGKNILIYSHQDATLHNVPATCR